MTKHTPATNTPIMDDMQEQAPPLIAIGERVVSLRGYGEGTVMKLRLSKQNSMALVNFTDHWPLWIMLSQLAPLVTPADEL